MPIDKRESILRCLELILTPIVRFCLRHSLTIGDLRLLAKKIFIHEAKHELERRGEKVNVARLCVISGLYRKDFENKEAIDPNTNERNLVMRVLGLWEQGREFTDTNGSPRVLSYKGENNEFSQLTAQITQAISSGTILFQLLRMKAVEKTENGLRLLRAANFVEGDIAQGFEIVTKDLDSVIQAAEQNLLQANEVPNLHIRTEYDNLSKDEFLRLKTWILEEGRDFQRKVRRELAKYDRDLNPRTLGEEPAEDEERYFLSVGTYSLGGEFVPQRRPTEKSSRK